MPELPTPPEKVRKSSSRSLKSPRSSTASGSSGGGPKRECACGRGMACAGMTQAFRMLGDQRRHFVELPHYRHDPPSFKYVFRNNLRASYIRNLEKCNSALDKSKFDDIRKRRFVAMHHFHPEVVKAFHDNPLTSAQKHKVPISITEHEMKELNIQMSEEDRILTVAGAPTGGYFFVPNYPPEKVHEDLKALVKKQRLSSEMKDSPKKTGDENSKENTGALTSVVRNKETVPDETEDDSSTDDVVDGSTELDEFVTGEFDDDDIAEAEDGKDGGSSKFDELWEKEQPAADNDLELQPISAVEDALPTEAMAHDVNTDEDNNETQEVVSSLASNPEGKDALSLIEESDSKDVNAEEDRSTQEVASSATTNTKETAAMDSNEGGDSDPSIAIASHSADESKSELSSEAGGKERVDDQSANSSQQALHREEPVVQEDDISSETDAANGATLSVEEETQHEVDEGEAVDGNPKEVDGDREQPQIAETELPGDGGDAGEEGDEDSSQTSSSPKKLTPRNSDHPWDLSKYRNVELETHQKKTSAAFIEPKKQSPSKEAPEGDDSEAANKSPRTTPSGMSIIEEGAREVSAAMETDPSPADVKNPDPAEEKPFQYLDFYDDDDEKSRNKYHASFAISKSASHDSGESKSAASVESIVSNAIMLNHELPGMDPTLRIQVHNDLIAMESKRRSEMKILLDFHKEQWYTAREILQTGVQNVEYAERVISGFAQAGMIFADILEAMYEDTLLDDRGNLVKRKFVQNRLHKKRSVQEYSIDAAKGELGQSALLNSLIQAQLVMAKSFDENARHLIDDLLPEITDLKHEIQKIAQELESLGNSVVGQLIASEVEVKNIWDVFDALVTGDLTEYSVHGSHHGSTHGGSTHSTGSTSLQGLIPEVSSNASAGLSPIKTTFRQLDSVGSIEDGWLIELLYKSAVSLQKSVFRLAQPELDKLYKDISVFEEKRLRKLHPLMMAFVPRQRRLFDDFPDHMKGVLDDLVGFRIDEESLQTHIDETLRDRSSDRLKKSEKHRSAIMNRSRLKAAKETPESVEEMERLYGSPFFSSMILLSHVVELKPFGFSGMVNNSWRFAMIVVTTEGYLHAFMMPREAESPLDLSPLEAFRSLYPPMEFEKQEDWARKHDIKRSLTPSITLDLRRCNIYVYDLELEVTEGELQTRNNFFGKNILKAVKDGGKGPTKCTMRLPSANDVSYWGGVLQTTKNDLVQAQKERRPN
eukprot:scaffold1638_cov120-Cylindrotheca_fusiformis.AAC.2